MKLGITHILDLLFSFVTSIYEEEQNMKKLMKIFCLSLFLTIFCVLACNGPTPEKGWGQKRAISPDDVKDFLNGDGAYNQPVASAEIAAINKQAFSEFYVFYKR